MINWKGRLQEMLAKRWKSECGIEFRIVYSTKAFGEDHKKRFRSTVTISGRGTYRGTVEKTKKASEQSAAMKAVEALSKREVREDVHEHGGTREDQKVLDVRKHDETREAKAQPPK
jgi:dsRNA-specific ribonuclease